MRKLEGGGTAREGAVDVVFVAGGNGGGAAVPGEPASIAFVTDSNRPQPLWQPPPTAYLNASGAASEVLSLLMHPCPYRMGRGCKPELELTVGSQPLHTAVGCWYGTVLEIQVHRMRCNCPKQPRSQSDSPPLMGRQFGCCGGVSGGCAPNPTSQQDVT